MIQQFHFWLNLLNHFSRVWLLVTPWTVAHQAPQSMRFSRQEYWSRLPYPSPGDLPNPRYRTTPVSYISYISRWILYHWPTREAQVLTAPHQKCKSGHCTWAVCCGSVYSRRNTGHWVSFGGERPALWKILESPSHLRILESLEIFRLRDETFCWEESVSCGQSRFILQALQEGLGQTDKVTENEFLL